MSAVRERLARGGSAPDPLLSSLAAIIEPCRHPRGRPRHEPELPALPHPQRFRHPGPPVNWRRSTHCVARECVEATSYRKSSHSGGSGQCVEAGHGPGVVGVRDSADRDGPVLEFRGEVWSAFTAALRAGRAVA